MAATATSSASRPDSSPDLPAAPSKKLNGGSASTPGEKVAGVPAPVVSPDPALTELEILRTQTKSMQRRARSLRKENEALRAELQKAADTPPKQSDPGPTPPVVEAKPTADETRAVVRSVRRQRTIKLLVRLALFVVLPTLLAATYYLALASDQFESHTSFTIHSADNGAAAGIGSLIGLVGAGSPSSTDTVAVREYVLTRDVLARLDKEHRFIEHYKSRKWDWYARLPSDASFEDAYEYYLDKVSAEFDSTSGTVTLRVRAFSADAAKRFASALLSYSEEKVNQLSERERRDRIGFAQAEVNETEKRLVGARQALLKLQQEHGDINPIKSAEAAFSIKTGLESALAQTQAELSAKLAYLTPDAPEVVELRAKARALSGQIVTENRKLVDPKKNRGVAEIFAAFESAAMEKEFAEKTYAASVTALELARSDANRQHRYLVPIAEPSLSDESTYPRRGLSIAGAGTLSLLAMGILSLLIAAIREHANI